MGVLLKILKKKSKLIVFIFFSAKVKKKKKYLIINEILQMHSITDSYYNSIKTI